MSKQRSSWVNPYGHEQIPNLVGQIFFPNAGVSLDRQDKQVIDKLIQGLDRVETRALLLGQSVKIRFVGYSSADGAAAHNLELSRRRAEAVKEYFMNQVIVKSAFTASAIGQGEAGPETVNMRCHYRRVDIYSNFVARRPSIHLDPIMITGTYSGNLSKKFFFDSKIGFSVAAGVAAVQAIILDITNPKTKRTCRYSYSGAGTGLGLGIFGKSLGKNIEKLGNLPGAALSTGSALVDTNIWLSEEDFEGWGTIFSVNAVLWTGTSFCFHGPMQKKRSATPIIVSTSGWNTSLQKLLSNPVPAVQMDIKGYFQRWYQ